MGETSNSGSNLLRETRTKAQESYLAGVVYSKCRVDLNRYPGPGRYKSLLDGGAFPWLPISYTACGR